jgi:nucleoid-associated protein YgaU
MVKVEKADTLKKLAAKWYGDQGRWREIYEANKTKMKSPGDLRVGQMIFIPEKDSAEAL